jgi:hypothetical protein
MEVDLPGEWISSSISIIIVKTEPEMTQMELKRLMVNACHTLKTIAVLALISHNPLLRFNYQFPKILTPKLSTNHHFPSLDISNLPK